MRRAVAGDHSFPWAHPWRTGRQVRRATARRAAHSHAVRQMPDATIDRNVGTMNSSEKERPDALISKSESEMLGVEAPRSRGNMHKQPCVPATAHARTTQSRAAYFEHPRPADGRSRRSATRPLATHDPALACGPAVLLHRRKP